MFHEDVPWGLLLLAVALYYVWLRGASDPDLGGFRGWK